MHFRGKLGHDSLIHSSDFDVKTFRCTVKLKLKLIELLQIIHEYLKF